MAARKPTVNVRKNLSDAQKTSLLNALLRVRHADPSEAVLFEVRGGPGYGPLAERRIDCLVGSMWRSNRSGAGRAFLGYEVKASRSDWKRELQDHRKRDLIDQVCAERWVCAWPGVVKDGELPAGWGLIEPSGFNKLVVRVQAVPQDATPPLGFSLQLMRLAAERQDKPAFQARHPSRWKPLFQYAGEELTVEQLEALVEKIHHTHRRTQEEQDAKLAEALAPLRAMEAQLRQAAARRQLWIQPAEMLQRLLEGQTEAPVNPQVQQYLASSARYLQQAQDLLTPKK